MTAGAALWLRPGAHAPGWSLACPLKQLKPQERPAARPLTPHAQNAAALRPSPARRPLPSPQALWRGPRRRRPRCRTSRAGHGPGRQTPPPAPPRQQAHAHQGGGHLGGATGKRSARSPPLLAAPGVHARVWPPGVQSLWQGCVVRCAAGAAPSPWRPGLHPRHEWPSRCGPQRALAGPEAYHQLQASSRARLAPQALPSSAAQQLPPRLRQQHCRGVHARLLLQLPRSRHIQRLALVHKPARQRPPPRKGVVLALRGQEGVCRAGGAACRLQGAGLLHGMARHRLGCTQSPD